MRFLLLLVLGVSIALLAHQAILFGSYLLRLQAERRRQIARALGIVGGKAPRRWHDDPFGRGTIADLRAGYRRLVVRSGRALEIGFVEFLALSGTLGLAIGAAAMALGAGAFTAVLLGLLTGALPGLWVRGRAERRGREIVRLLPGFMDLLVLSVESGLDFTSAVARIIDRATPSALTEEMRIVLLEIRLGAARRAALRSLSGRLDLPEIRALAAAIIQADRYGVSLGQTLRIQAEQVRARRFERAEQRAGRAAVLISLPTVLFLVPCVFLILVGPYVPEVLRSLGTGL